MLASAIPTRFSIPFANSAGAGFTRPIPTASQIGIQAGAASLTDGFPPVCFLPIGAGGTPPWGADFNGILNQISAWSRWYNAGGIIAYNSTYSSDIGGYPNGALIASATVSGQYWLSTADNNTSDPDAGGANWQSIPLSGGTLTTGAHTWRPTQETVTGWAKANGTTIGNASSGATQLASATASALFSWLWTNFSNTQCPVSGGRGASAAADFAASKTIQILDMRGLAPIGMDTMGGSPTTLLASVPVVFGSATQSGSVLGENLHALIIAELAAHTHGVTDPTHVHSISDPTHNHAYDTRGALTSFGPGGVPNSWIQVIGASTTSSVTGIAINAASTGISLQSTGSGTAHNTVHRSMTGTHYLKL